MSSNFIEEKEKELIEMNTNKKSLRSVLTSYMKKQKADHKTKDKMKKEFVEITNNMNEVKSSYETLMSIHKKLSKAYDQLNEKNQ